MNENLRSNTIWITVKKQLEITIIDGTYKSAEKVPSISEVAKIYSCGKTTAQKVLEDMYDEGTITKQKGVGYFVKPFAREKLLAKYKEKWTADLKHGIYEAFLLGVNKNEIEKLMEKEIASIYTS